MADHPFDAAVGGATIDISNRPFQLNANFRANPNSLDRAVADKVQSPRFGAAMCLILRKTTMRMNMWLRLMLFLLFAGVIFLLPAQTPAQICVGGCCCPSIYTITNGVIWTSGVDVQCSGLLYQSGGSILSSGEASVSGCLVGPNPGHWEYAYYDLSGGAISSASMYVSVATVTHTGGTNITGSLSVNGGAYEFYGGALITDYTSINTLPNGGYGLIQGGGLHSVARQLFIRKGWAEYYSGPDYDLAGGMLMASNIVISSQAYFVQSSGSIIVTGTLSLADCTFGVGPGFQQLGQLVLSMPAGRSAVLYMPESSCVLHFADSSTMTWSSNAGLVIDGWSNSVGASGPNRIIFGVDATALTTSQVAQISFRNPRGLPSGTYPAQILHSGEVVPQGLPGNECRLTCPTNITVCNDPGQCGAVVNFGPPATTNCAGYVVAANPPSGSFFPVGSNTVTWLAVDSASGQLTNTCSFLITVRDCEPPVIHSITASPATLWPPNHKMQPVTLHVVATDNCRVARSRIIAVSSNEGSASDWQITGDLTLNLRAERAGHGQDRVYEITVECADDSGNASRAVVRVRLRHER